MSSGSGVARLRQVDPEEEVLLEIWPPRLRDDLRGLRLPGWRAASYRLTLEKVDVVRVHVVDEQGRPVPGATITGDPWDPMILPMSDETGTVLVPRPTDRRHALRARADARSSDLTTVDPRASDVSVVVREREGVLRVRITSGDDPRSAKERRCSAAGPRVTLWDPAEPTLPLNGMFVADGNVEFRGLRPDGRFDVLFRYEEHPETAGFAQGLRADGSLQSIPWVPTKTLRGRVVLEPYDDFRGVEVLEAGRTDTRLDETGHFAVRGLPEGRWTLRATVLRRREPLYATVVVEGEAVPDLVFPPR